MGGFLLILEDNMKMTFGKYIGQEISDLPTSYMDWLIGNGMMPSDIHREVEREFHNRKNPTQGYTTKLPLTEFINQLGQLLNKAPDKFFDGAFTIKLPDGYIIVSATKNKGKENEDHN